MYKGSRHPFAGDIADGEPQAIRPQVEDVVEIAADRARGTDGGADIGARVGRQCSRQHAQLDALCLCQLVRQHLLLDNLLLGCFEFQVGLVQPAVFLLEIADRGVFGGAQPAAEIAQQLKAHLRKLQQQ